MKQSLNIIMLFFSHYELKARHKLVCQKKSLHRSDSALFTIFTAFSYKQWIMELAVLWFTTHATISTNSSYSIITSTDL